MLFVQAFNGRAKGFARNLVLAFGLTVTLVANADGIQADGAYGVVRTVTSQILDLMQNGAHTDQSSDEKTFYSAVENVLNPVVDFRFIARGVMGGYAKKATPEQRDRFVDVFKRSMISTYAKGMASYGDLQIEILPPNGDISGLKKVTVAQEVKTPGKDGASRISYTMRRNNQGEWKLTNVVLNGVNLGKTFRGQFSQAMKKNAGNLDQVIAGWAAESSDKTDS